MEAADGNCPWIIKHRRRQSAKWFCDVSCFPTTWNSVNNILTVFEVHPSLPLLALMFRESWTMTHLSVSDITKGTDTSLMLVTILLKALHSASVCQKLTHGHLAGSCKQRVNRLFFFFALDCHDFQAAPLEWMKKAENVGLLRSPRAAIGKPDKCSRSWRGGGGK